MLPSPTLRALQTQLRQSICRRCANAPRASRSLGPDVPRSCEKRCPLFGQLPRLKRTAELLDPTLRCRRLELEHLITQLAAQDPKAATSPLVRYRKRIAAAIDSLYGW